jgi:antitoxin (DNA-binding transcriptional repressor) of toxin-antitoxin stability system
MHTVNIHDAMTNLWKLIDKGFKGEAFIIGKAGKLLVKVVAIAQADSPTPRIIGFMKGRVSVPEHYDELGREEISDLFQGS